MRNPLGARLSSYSLMEDIQLPSIMEDSPLEAPISGFNRHQKLMSPATRELVLKSRQTEIEAFAQDRGLDPAMVAMVAEVAMRTGRVPELRQYGFAGDEAKAIKHFLGGEILNLAIEDIEEAAYFQEPSGDEMEKLIKKVGKKIKQDVSFGDYDVAYIRAKNGFFLSNNDGLRVRNDEGGKFLDGPKYSDGKGRYKESVVMREIMTFWKQAEASHKKKEAAKVKKTLRKKKWVSVSKRESLFFDKEHGFLAESIEMDLDESVAYVTELAEQVIAEAKAGIYTDHMSPETYKKVSKLFLTAAQKVLTANTLLRMRLPNHTWPVQLSNHLHSFLAAFMDKGNVHTANRYVEKMRAALGRKAEIPPASATDYDYARKHVKENRTPDKERGFLAEKSPKGWKGTVEKMKDKPEIDNPYALAYHMKKQGAEPHYAEPEKKGDEPKKKQKFKNEESAMLGDENINEATTSSGAGADPMAMGSAFIERPRQLFSINQWEKTKEENKAINADPWLGVDMEHQTGYTLQDILAMDSPQPQTVAEGSGLEGRGKKGGTPLSKKLKFSKKKITSPAEDPPGDFDTASGGTASGDTDTHGRLKEMKFDKNLGFFMEAKKTTPA